MPRRAKTPRSKLADQLTEVLLTTGYDGASLAAFSAATGLSKASLYHHFPGGKEDMAGYVLARLGARLQAQVIAPLIGDGPPAERLAASLAATRRYYSGNVPACVMNSLALGSGQAHFAGALKQGLGAWQSSLAAVLAQSGLTAEAAARQATAVIARIQGALVLCRVAGNRAPLDDALDALETELLPHRA